MESMSLPANLYPQAASGDSLLGHAPTVESPLPGGVAAVVRLVFNQPSWFQITSAIVGVLVVVTVFLYLWRRRAAIVAWVRTRRRSVQIAVVVGLVAVALGAAGFGTFSWNYMQHDNGFCTGCHVMGPAYARFTESEHKTLSCHACHQQSIAASMRQLYLWVAERPAEIGPHAKVATAVCAQCHITDQKEVWQRIATTAGHRTHLESDSSALTGVQCVTCHGVEVHHFAPLDRTCAQAGCHDMNTIALGKMRGQTALHCTSCHRFTADVPALATRDSAAGTLVPSERQCFSCHQMRDRLAGMNMDPSRDPHRGSCGMCHNPHRQEQPTAARATCTNAGCHADWRKEPFHVGPGHRRVGERCTTCHLPHQARVDASDCAGCHAAVRQRAGRLTPPLPFDTTAAKRRVSLAPPPRFAPVKGKGDAPFVDDPPALVAPRAPPDTFPHNRHRSLSCITCHLSKQGHGRLAFETPRGCQICHHQAPASAECATCHRTEALAAPKSVTILVAVAHAPPRSHPALFDHSRHARRKCVECHTTPVSLAPGAEALRCAACHDDHHAAGRPCATCHTEIGPEARAAHAPPLDAHRACDACHLPDIVARLVPDRALCLTCHAAQRDHYAAQECTTCHFQAPPVEFQPHLRRVEQGS